MKKIEIVLFGFLVYGIPIFSQPVIQWDKTIGGNSYEDSPDVHQTTDGGYIVGGGSISNASGDKSENRIGYQDYWIVKLNAAGSIQWENTIGGDSMDFFSSIEQTADGGYILGGYSQSNISGDKTENCKGNNDYWVVKLDGTGNIQWQKTIGGNDQDELYSLQQTTDGGYILGGYSRSNISGDKTENSKGSADYWIVKLDASGNIQWDKTIGGALGDALFCLRQTINGGYILGGLSTSNISGDKTDTCRGGLDYWVVKIDSVGTIQWDKTIGGSNDDSPLAIQQTTDDGYFLGGTSYSSISGDKTENLCNPGQSDYWVLKLDSIGNIQWQNDIGSNGQNALYSVSQTTDGGYIVGGHSDGLIWCDKTENLIGGQDYWILKLDIAGNIVWQKTIGGNNTDALTSMEQTSDGGFILGGWSLSNISGDKTENSKGASDYWIVKLAPYVGVEEEENFLSFDVYPNPATNEIRIKNAELKIERIEIYDVLGQKVFSEAFSSTTHTINVSGLPAGVYWCRVINEEKKVFGTQKLVVVH